MRQVIVKFKAFQEMVKYLFQYSSFKLPKSKWVESMGFLFCSIEGDYYIIDDAIGMGFGSELDVNISPMKFGNIDQLEREKGGFLGGWWHTHPDLTPFFSETDIQNQMFYQQNNEDGLGIVFDHTMISKDFIGFKISRLKNKFSIEYVEVDYQLEGFSKEGIKKTMEIIGVPSDITTALAEKYGGKKFSLKIDFSKLGEPICSDPESDCDWMIMEAEDLLKKDKIVDAIKKYKMASKILENTELQNKLANTLYTLIKLCVKHNYMDNAKEEFIQLKKLMNYIDSEKFNEMNKILS